MKLGADDYMAKPFNSIDLLNNVALKIKKRKDNLRHRCTNILVTNNE